jgi:predicted sulfurtransferase
LVAVAAQTIGSDGVPRVTQADFKKLIADNNLVVVDTRNVDAYRAGHIPGAILLPLEGQRSWPFDYESTVDTLKAATKPIVAYCA